MIKFAYTILYVRDVEKAISFYETVFEFKRKFITPDNNYGELITGETTLGFANGLFATGNFVNGFIESSLDNKPFGIEIAFVTDDVAGLYEKAINAGAVSTAEPTSKPWGQIVAYIRDLDGFLVEICSPVPE